MSVLLMGIAFSFPLNASDSLGTDVLDITTVIPPTTDSKLNPSIVNILGSVNILNLSGKDALGVPLENFVIHSLPDSEQGVLYLEDESTVVEIEEVLTKEQSDGLKFDPNENFEGDVIFTYMVVDAHGNRGNLAIVTIPVTNSTVNNSSESNHTALEHNSDNVPVFSMIGVIMMILLSTLMGFIFMAKELEQN